MEEIKHTCLVGGISVERNGFEGRNFDGCVLKTSDTSILMVWPGVLVR